MMEAFGTVQDKKIHELTEIFDERSGQGRTATDGKNSQQIIVIDGQGYERVTSNGDKIYDLTEVVEHNHLSPQIDDAVMKQTVEIIKRIARDVIPDIAERVIREEIEKIKIMRKDRLSDQG